ncbi:polymer-forming cytoskeletal protein [Hyphomicrobium sp.]|jgi:cytoskeletal protein CcmA (bactofilin family)|uniref:polymer-forming cytoskeletal protein n=1 Tax=Hyphomicrobium sp. TaxID=82 RepID=UPI002CBA2C45|nr:polymer-forming cytoskeletal protein [Hyphomicrobium sp.]HVZ03683.1 polymer-forming cytoskeletal protein [Hyphomicrobium sp.]
MPDTRGVLIVGEGAVLKGEVRSGRRVEIWGYVEGGVTASEVVVQEGGKLFGQVKSDTAEIRGTVQGDVRVQQLFALRSTGSAAGKIKYGRLSMEEGAELSAHIRNIPPAIAGDLDLTVGKGRSVRITLADLNAVDPDDKPEDLTFTVSNAQGGFVALANAPKSPIATFSQADLAEGCVLFAHDGSDASSARFDVQVTDASGANSGKPQTVNVAVRA